MVAIWNEAADKDQRYPALSGRTETDVAIIGGGITGLTLALQLAESGMRVQVLEAHRVGRSNSGNSTGNIYATLASGLAPLRKKWGDEVLADVVRSRTEAVTHIEFLVDRFGIDCQFARRPLYRIQTSDDPETSRSIDQERDASDCAGLAPHAVPDQLFGLQVQHGLMLDNQAQFNPLSYCQGLARAAAGLGVGIHEKSPVREINYDQRLLKTDTAEVKASHIVHATHTPKGIDLLQSGMLPSREYGVSARLAAGPMPGSGSRTGTLPEGTLWVLDPFHSLRSYHHGGTDYIIAVGEKHNGGEGKLGEGYYERLRQYLRQHFNVESFEHQWSAQQFRSADGLPYIGRMLGAVDTWLATGFGADGLVWGTLAGMILGDELRGRKNHWSSRYDSMRFTPAKSLKGWTKENVKVTRDLVKDYLQPNRLKSLDEVKPGEGKVISLDGEKLAVYRDPAGQCSVVSAICPHLKCVVHFNGADTSWDCPCHGSRFRTDGSVIEGPAFTALERRTPPDAEPGVNPIRP